MSRYERHDKQGHGQCSPDPSRPRSRREGSGKPDTDDKDEEK